MSRQRLLREGSSQFLSKSYPERGDEGGKTQEQPLFPTIAAVPTKALTLTIPAIMRSRVVLCVATGEGEREGTGKKT